MSAVAPPPELLSATVAVLCWLAWVLRPSWLERQKGWEITAGVLYVSGFVLLAIADALLVAPFAALWQGWKQRAGD